MKMFTTPLVKRAQFTDDGGASGHFDVVQKLPSGIMILGGKVQVSKGFTGDTTASMFATDTGGTLGYFFTSQGAVISVLNTGTIVAAADFTTGNNIIPVDTTIRIKVTGGADFTSITQGELQLTLFFWDLINTKPI